MPVVLQVGQPLIQLLQDAAIGGLFVDIVLVRWIARPVSGQRNNLGEEETARLVLAHQNVPDMALRVALASRVFRIRCCSNEASLFAIFARGGCANSNLCITRSLDFVRRLGRQIYGSRRHRKGAGTIPDLVPRACTRYNSHRPGHDDERNFDVIRLLSDTLLRPHTNDSKVNALPIVAVLRDRNHLPVLNFIAADHQRCALAPSR